MKHCETCTCPSASEKRQVPRHLPRIVPDDDETADETKPELLKAALSVEMNHITKLEAALRGLIHAARTSGGTAGRDEYLVKYCEAAEQVLNYEYERSAQETPPNEHPLVRALARRVWLTSERYLSGYRLTIGFETLSDVQAAHTEMTQAGSPVETSANESPAGRQDQGRQGAMAAPDPTPAVGDSAEKAP